MNTYVTLFLNNQWHCLNIDNDEDYHCGDRPVTGRSNTLITFQSLDLTRVLNTSGELPSIIDLESLDRQMSQKGKDLREYKEWRVMPFLRRFSVIEDDFVLNDGTIKRLLEAIVQVYEQLLNVASDDEARRFEELEVQVNKIIFQRQQTGICVDLKIARKKCQELEAEIYQIKNEFQLQHNIFSPDNIEQQISYLASKKYKRSDSIKYVFRDYRFEDPLSDLFYRLIRIQEDFDSFLFILANWSSGGLVRPQFFGFGTITGRITMRQVALQNLRKANRNVIVPKEGFRLLYADYSQFEAGILASLSDDDKLIALYDSDIYSDIASKILKNAENRAQAKVLFYRFMYGDRSLSQEVENYFDQFAKLKIFREDITERINTQGKVGTTFGNFRKASSEGNEWALSHVVQATASLIYKRALVRTRNEVRSADFLIPMHDATLYQLPIMGYDKLSERIKTIYEEEFKRMCPKITPKVSLSDVFN